MQIRPVTEAFAVSPQIQKFDAEAIAEAGFKRVVNNRPDGEAPGQPTSLHLMTAISAAGVGYQHIPVVGSAISDADVEEFRHALDMARGPVLAFCASGMRSLVLWALAEAGRRSTDEIIQCGARAGFNLTPMRAKLDLCAQRHQGEAAAGA